MENLSSTTSSDPLRLALVITELQPGGAERCLVELATRLDRTRFAPIVYSLGSRPPQGRQTLVQRLAEGQIPTHFLDLYRGWQYFAGVRRLANLLRQQRAQIVQTFLFHANVVGARAARLADVPHVLTGVRVADPRRWRALIERWATASADRIICVSRGVADFCRRRGFAAGKLVVIPNGIDIATWRNAQPALLQQFGVPSGRRIFLYVGRLDEQKGLDRLLDELPRVFAELPDHNLLVVGDGKQRQSLFDRCARLGISDRVNFAGWRTDTPSVMAAAELLVLPSRWEGMPNVVLEAMAAAKPVVAMRAEGIEELLGPTADQQSTQVGHWDAFRDRLIAILRDHERATQLGQWNQLRAAQEFSTEFMVAKYVDLYTQFDRLGREKN